MWPFCWEMVVKGRFPNSSTFAWTPCITGRVSQTDDEQPMVFLNTASFVFHFALYMGICSPSKTIKNRGFSRVL